MTESNCATSSFASVFSTLFSNYIFIFRGFPYFEREREREIPKSDVSVCVRVLHNTENKCLKADFHIFELIYLHQCVTVLLQAGINVGKTSELVGY